MLPSSSWTVMYSALSPRLRYGKKISLKYHLTVLTTRNVQVLHRCIMLVDVFARQKRRKSKLQLQTFYGQLCNIYSPRSLMTVILAEGAANMSSASTVGRIHNYNSHPYKNPCHVSMARYSYAFICTCPGLDTVSHVQPNMGGP